MISIGAAPEGGSEKNYAPSNNEIIFHQCGRTSIAATANADRTANPQILLTIASSKLFIRLAAAGVSKIDLAMLPPNCKTVSGLSAGNPLRALPFAIQHRHDHSSASLP